jgi:hypothetical protein
VGRPSGLLARADLAACVIDGDVARLRRNRAYGYIRGNVPAAAIKTLLFSLGYVFLLIAGLVIVNIALGRLTREEREAERQRRRQRKTS